VIDEKQKINKSFQFNNLLLFVVALLLFLITSSFCFASSNKPLLFLGDKDYPPYEWLEEGTPTGLNVDICREISRVIGREIKVELMQWKTAQEKVLKGEADGLIEIDISEERKKLYDLTETTIEFSYSLFVQSDNVVISEVSDVEGKKVGVTAGGYPRRVLEKNPKIDLIFVKNFLEGFEYLKSGKIDALGADTWVAPYLIQKHGIKGIVITGDPFFKIKGAFAVKKGNTKLLNEIDAGIEKLIKDGTLARLKKKWSRKEIIFLTQEKLQRIYIIVTILCLGVLSSLLLLWIFTLKKQIRKRNKAEAELQQAHDDLEQRVKERTFDLEKINKELQSEITERKQVEEALRESEEHYRTVLEANPDPVVVYDMEGKVTYLNPAFTRVFGWSLEERIGKKMDDFVPEENWPETKMMIDKVLAGILFSGIETLRYNKDKKIIPVALSASVYRDQEGDITASVINLRDITQQKTIEARLQQAQKMEAIGTLAGGVAHDLNNILSGIVSYPELILLDLPEDSPLRESILTIQESGQKAAVIVQDLLTLARRGVAITEVVNLTDIISQQLKSPEFEKLLSFNPDVKVETHFEKNLLNIKGSTTHLSKSIMNLASNAAEAMIDGGAILISTENRYIDRPVKGYDHVEEGDYVIVTVSDTGVGMSAEDKEKIFEPFYTKKAMGRSGTGLGMPVVWGTVKDHKGYIDLKSTLGKGTTFTLYFPVTREEAAADESWLSIEDYMGQGETILIIDDVKSQRKIASSILTKLGYSVTTVSSGEEAVEYMENNTADLLVLDMIMDPGIDGLETYKRILELHPGQKAIIASGFSESERAKEAKNLGAGAYVKKPYLIEKIGIVVRNELKK